jgi:hypothetical protein
MFTGGSAGSVPFCFALHGRFRQLRLRGHHPLRASDRVHVRRQPVVPHTCDHAPVFRQHTVLRRSEYTHPVSHNCFYYTSKPECAISDDNTHPNVLTRLACQYIQIGNSMLLQLVYALLCNILRSDVHNLTAFTRLCNLGHACLPLVLHHCGRLHPGKPRLSFFCTG